MIETQSYQVGEAEAALIARSQRIPLRPRVIWGLINVVLALTPYAVGAWLLLQFGEFSWTALGLIVVVSIGFALCFQPLIRRRATASMAKWAMGRMSPAAFMQTFTADESGFKIASALAETRCKWPYVQEIAETSSHLVFRVGPLNVYVVPKSALGADAAIEQIQSWWAAAPRP